MKHLIALLALFAAPAIAEPTAQPAPPQAQGPSLEQIAMLFFRQYDGNADGTVTRREFLTPSMNQFDYLDRNRDGSVDMQEVSDFVQMMTQQGQPQ